MLFRTALYSISTVLKVFAERTIGEHAGGGQLDVGQGPEVVKHGTTVALLLRVIYKGANVVLFTVVSDAWADNHGDVRCREKEKATTRKCDRQQFACWSGHV